MKSWILAARPKTLTAAVVPIVVGASLAYSRFAENSIWIVACIVFSAVCIQVATNLINDAIDFKKGADTDQRLGPIRVTQSGLLTSKQVMTGGIGFLGLAVLFGLPLVYQAGLPILAIGLASLILAYSYTGGPFPLAYLGLGDIFVFVFFGLIAVSGTYYIVSGKIDVDVLVAGAQMGLLATVLIAINNLRDVDQDSVASKRTLAVRFGIHFVRREIGLLIFFSFALGFYWAFTGKFWAAMLPLMMVPVGYDIYQQVFEVPPSTVYNKFLAQSAGLHAGFGILLSIGLAIS